MLRKTFMMVAMAGAMAFATAASAAIPASSFEAAPGDFDGWADSFGSRPIVMDAGTIGATDGVQSLALTLTGDGFAWDITKSYTDDLAAFSAAIAAGGNVEFDLTFDTSTIPQSVVSYISWSLALNDGSWTSKTVSPSTNGHTDETRHVVLSLAGDLGGQTIGEGATYYILYIGFNGDWKDDLDPRNTESVTVYLDNIVITPEPASVALLGLGCAMIAGRRRA